MNELPCFIYAWPEDDSRYNRDVLCYVPRAYV